MIYRKTICKCMKNILINKCFLENIYCFTINLLCFTCFGAYLSFQNLKSGLYIKCVSHFFLSLFYLSKVCRCCSCQFLKEIGEVSL